MPLRKKTIIFLGVVGALAAAVVLSGGTKPGNNPLPDMSMMVETAKVEQATLQKTLTAIGSLVAQEGITIRPEIGGRVSEILFTEGQKVEKGTPLLRLDDSIYRAQLAQAEAQLALTQRNFSRAQTLVGRGVGTEQARDQASSDQRVSAAAVELARANLDKTLITAPFTGVVGIRKVSPGDVVAAGQDIVTLQSLNPMKLDFQVPETALAGLHGGQKVQLTVAAYPGETFTGQVVAIDPLVDANTRSVALRALVPNEESKLRPGLFGNVTLVLAEEQNALYVPASAIWPVGSKAYVFKVSDGKALMTEVTIAQREANRVALSSGVGAGEEVVTAGQLKLTMGPPGQPVPVKTAAQAAEETPVPVTPEAK